MTKRFACHTFVCGALLIISVVAPAQAQELSEQANVARAGAFISAVNPQLPHLIDRAYAKEALVAAQAAHIDPCLLLAVVSVESSWKADAVSKHGAIGLGQLKPTTAASLNANPYSVAENLRATSLYLRSLLKRFSPRQPAGPTNSHVAIAAYQQGPGAVSRAMAVNGNQLPTPFAGSYVRRVVTMWQAARSRLSTTLADNAEGPHEMPLAARAIVAAEADLHPAVATVAAAHPPAATVAATHPAATIVAAAHQPDLLRDERTYWGITDSSPAKTNAFYSNIPAVSTSLLLIEGL